MNRETERPKSIGTLIADQISLLAVLSAHRLIYDPLVRSVSSDEVKAHKEIARLLDSKLNSNAGVR